MHIHIHTSKQAQTSMHRLRDRHKQAHASKQTDRQTGRHTSRQAGRQTAGVGLMFTPMPKLMRKKQRTKSEGAPTKQHQRKHSVLIPISGMLDASVAGVAVVLLVVLVLV